MKFVVPLVGCAAALKNPFTGLTLQSMETELLVTCGQACVNSFHNMVHELNSQDLNSSEAWLQGVTKMMEGVNTQAHLMLSSTQTRTSLVSKSHAKTGVFGGTPCDSEASCTLVQAFANKCNYARISLQQSYEAVNVAAHVLGVMTSVLCGCVYGGTEAKCLLEGVPPTCVFPYMVYSRLFSASNELWEAVKGTTKACGVHGDARISS